MDSHLKKVNKIPSKSPKIATGLVEIILFFVVICLILTGFFFVIVSVPFWLIASTLAWFYPVYGKFVGCYDLWMREDFKGTIPRLSIVSTITIDGDINLASLKRIFTENVLKAQQAGKRPRYPELKQYLTTFLGYRIWKNDSEFNIDNHITEKPNNQVVDFDLLIPRIHEELHNKPYNKYRSPWEVILIRNVETRKSTLAIRLNHGMADGKSVLKLIVECLGGKSLKTANTQASIKQGFLQWCLTYVMFPVHYYKSVLYTTRLGVQTHPWKNQNLDGDGCVPWVVTFSPKFKLGDIKKVAQQYSVNTSAVVLALVTGGIRSVGQELRNQDVATDLPMPRSGHPETLTNHFYFGSVILPTSECSTVKRLRKCQKAFTRLKSNGFLELIHSQVLQIGVMLPLFGKYFSYNYYYTMSITNMAGDEDGFSVGNFPCSDFEMTCGMPGCGALAVYLLSYKDSVRIGVATKENLLSYEDAHMLATNISLELKNLLFEN